MNSKKTSHLGYICESGRREGENIVDGAKKSELGAEGTKCEIWGWVNNPIHLKQDLNQHGHICESVVGSTTQCA
jgi:hypothetical protein